MLIVGESGSGKELVARTIHERSGRATHPFVPVNAAAIPETLVEGEFFGFERGAFTGANATHAGLFEQAHRGTLFLDEVTEMPPALQPIVQPVDDWNRNFKLGLLVEAMGATGIRVSEVRYLTVEAARQGKAEISLKGKIRTILLPGKLCRKLLQYAQKQKTASGAIFRTKSGKELGRRQIWAEMKRLCGHAGVDPRKVFPHNLRHLFAMVFYRTSRDIVKLADLLGHSSIETTRIYLVTSGAEHQRTLDRLGLIS